MKRITQIVLIPLFLLFLPLACTQQGRSVGTPTQSDPRHDDEEEDDAQIQKIAQQLMSTMKPLASLKKGDVIGKFIDTYYFLAFEGDYPHDKKTVPLKDKDGKVIAMISPELAEHLTEGSLKLLDGRILNTSEKDWFVSDSPTGMGVSNCNLIPWHTMAVDPKVIPLGTIVQIDETVGMKLPDGTIHDGIWRAEDIGGAIQNGHVDLFVGTGEKNGEVLDKAGVHLKPLTIRYMSTPKASCIHPN